MKAMPLLWTALILTLLAGRAGATDITACGQLVPAGDVGVLQADLDCGGDEASGLCLGEVALACAKDPGCTDTGCGGILLREYATLQMNGHTVANGTVFCPLRSCSVVGPGTIAGGYGLVSVANLNASGLDVHGGEVGIAAYEGKTTLQDITVSDVESSWGIQAYKRLHMTNVAVSNCKIGIVSWRSLKGSGITANDNRQAGVLAYGGLRVTGLTATGNGLDPEVGSGGIVAVHARIRLESSQVTGNFYHGTTPLDLNTAKRPRLVDTTCDHSGDLETSNHTPWGVCSQD